ncbi:MAG: hypothetical protein LDL33_14065 [Desulfomonile sp.]|nr:hypothetical protein [Desulfomonile sp.]
MGPLNNLITSAQVLLDGGFDVDAFLAWRELAYMCLLGLLGPMHYYTKTFAQFTRHPDERGLLAGGGLLTAAREHIVKTVTDPAENTYAHGSLPHGRFKPWLLRQKKWHPLTTLRENQSA